MAERRSDHVSITVKLSKNGRSSNVTLVRPLSTGGNPKRHANEIRRQGGDVLAAAIAALILEEG